MRRLAVLALFLLPTLALAQTWESAGPGPGPRGWQQSSYDPATRTVVTFGGSVSTYSNDTWLIDLVTGVSTQRRPMPDIPTPTHAAPCSRDGHNFVYVPAWDRHLLIQGWLGGPVTPNTYPDCLPPKRGAAYDVATDTWADRPIENHIRNSAQGAALHPPTGHVYLYPGGTNEGYVSTARLDRLELYAAPDGAGFWGKRVSMPLTGPIPSTAPNVENALVWVPPLGKFLTLAGRGTAWGAWLIDPTTGTVTAANATATGGVFPPYREYHGLAWDPTTQAVYLQGGKDYTTGVFLTDTWRWEPLTNTWTDLTPTVGPRQSQFHTLVADGGTLWIVPGAAKQAGHTGMYRLTLTPPVLRTLTLTVVGSGAVDPPGVSQHPEGSTVTLSGTPAAGWIGPTWSGDADCADGSVMLAADRACTGTFTPAPLTPGYRVTTDASGTVTIVWVANPVAGEVLWDCPSLVHDLIACQQRGEP